MLTSISQRQVRFPLQSKVLNLTQKKEAANMGKLKKISGLLEKSMNVIFTVCGFVAVAFVLVITIFLVVSGTPAIGEIGLTEFLFGTKWASTAAEPSYGILPFILSSVYGTFGAILIGVPLGILCAVFLTKIAGKRTASFVSGAVNLMSGIPSVVYGLVGMIIIVPTVREMFGLPDGANLFSAILVLAVMILPSVISVSETAIRAVPKEYEEASLALGATKNGNNFQGDIACRQKRYSCISGTRNRQGDRRGNGGHDGSRKRCQYARIVQKRPLSHNSSCKRDVLFFRIAETGIVFCSVGAVCVHSGYQSCAESDRKKEQEVMI